MIDTTAASKPVRRLAGLAMAGAIYTYILVVYGGIVRITGSGMGCGDDWPNCNDAIVPTFDLTVFIEYSHRVLAAGLSLLTLWIVAQAIRHRAVPGVTGRGGVGRPAWLAAALSGSNEVYQAGMAYANSLLKGHGRDNELEADEAAARYMVKLGYDPEEMLDMLTTMKDLEILQKDRAAQMGAPRRTYHGIFSSHPRSDMRLRSGVAKAERLATGGPKRDAAASTAPWASRSKV